MTSLLTYLITGFFLLNLCVGRATATPFEQDPGSDGLVSMEAEDFDNNVAQGGNTWEFVSSPSGFSGDGAMQALPNTGVIHNADYVTASPRLDYKVKFVKTGTHYVWVRGNSLGDSNNDSFHTGLDGQAVSTADRGYLSIAAIWAWRNFDMDGGLLTIIIDKVGVHTVNIWMREDGAVIDKIVLTTNPGYQPTDEGPVESQRGSPGKAEKESPANVATDIIRDTLLTWTPGKFAATHDVYFGTSFDDVNTASRADPKDVLASKGQTGATFDPPGLLDFGQTYHWRVDEVNAPDKPGYYKGNVWSFTVEPYAYPVRPMKATASSLNHQQTGPEKTIDGSGLDALDQHSVESSDMWLSNKKGPTPIWIQYEFDTVYSLHEMWVWNQNQMDEPDNGYGAQDVTIEVSTDGSNWKALEGVPEFGQGMGEPNYVHNTTVSFGGELAKYVKLNIESNWGGMKISGLSEVRFYQVPMKAYGPTPATGTKDVAVDGVLYWRPGRTAVSHEVYLGTNPNGLSKVGTSTDHSYSMASAGVEYDRTYYWKVNEVEPLKTWDGDVWSFSTSRYFIVDDFESYNDRCNRVYYTWADGYGATTASECGAVTIGGNGSGAAVGNQSAPYAERTIVHGGNQSMPLFYDNPGASSYSEATRTFVVGQDWVQGGVKTLVLYFYGASDNAAGQLYVKVNNTKVVYNGKSDALAIPMWRQWNVDLASLGGTLRSVTTLAVGVSGSGSGKVLIDDIRLYREAPPVPVPVDPGMAGLAAYYAFEGDVKDGSGKGLNGTANGDPAYLPSPAGMGQAMVFDGINDHVDLPIGNLISTLTSATFTSWVNVDPQVAAAWPRIFDFGKGNTDYIQLTPHQGTDGPLTCDIRVNNVETRFAAARILPTGWHHVAVVVDGAAMTIKVYQDGTVVAEGSTPVLPKDLGVTNQNWLGRSQWTADAYFVGQLDEFRIYNRALAEAEVRYLAGDR